MKKRDTQKSRPLPPGALQDMLWTIHLLCRKAEPDELRFRSNPAMDFPVNEVKSVRKLPEGDKYKYELSVNTGGLGGTSGPLPIWLNELLAFEDPDNAPLGDFLDIFSHRFVRALYGAWIKHKPELTWQPKAKDTISRMLLSLAGVHSAFKFFGPKDFFQQERLCAYIGTMGHHPVSAVSLSGMLRDYFKDVPFYVKQFVSDKRPIIKEDRACLGENTILGKNMVPGEQVKTIHSKFRVVTGPLERDVFENFLPGMPGHKQLSLLVKMFSPPHLKWDFSLCIKGEAIPKLCLGAKETDFRLGYNTWLVSKPRGDDEITF